MASLMVEIDGRKVADAVTRAMDRGINPDGRERRVVDVTMEARAENDARRLVGYAAMYGREATIGGFFREVIEPGAFRSAIDRRDDVRALFNHDANLMLGRTASGTVRLTEDEVGLRYEADLPDTQFARDLWTLVKRGDVTQSSFAFSVDAEEWRDLASKDLLPLRVIKSVRLYDVSPVTFPAYDETTVAARNSAESLTQAAVLAARKAWLAQLATRQAETDTVAVAWRRVS